MIPPFSNAPTQIATTSRFGKVKPDGTTITISSGVISAASSVAASYLAVSKATSFTASSGTGTQSLTFDSPTSDPDGLWDAANNQAVIKRAGVYVIEFERGGPSAVQAEPSILVNGTQVSFPSTSGSQFYAATTRIIYLNVSDTVKVQIFKTSAITINYASPSGGLRLSGPL